MRFSFLAIAATLSATALSQSLSSLPPCAQSCVGNSLSTTGCNSLDIACICASSGWIQMLSCCLTQTCSPADQNATIVFADQICDTAGVTVPTAVSCAATQISSTAASTATGNSNSTESSTSAESTNTSKANSESSTGSTAGGATTSTKASSSTSSSATSNAAPRDAYGVGLGMAAAGLIAAVL